MSQYLIDEPSFESQLMSQKLGTIGNSIVLCVVCYHRNRLLTSSVKVLLYPLSEQKLTTILFRRHIYGNWSDGDLAYNSLSISFLVLFGNNLTLKVSLHPRLE